MVRTLDRAGDGYRLCIPGDLNGWVGDRMRTGITDTFRVSGENDNGRSVVELLLKGDCVCITYTLSTGVCISTQGCGGKEHDRSSASEEGYAAICAGCLGGERNGRRPLRSPYCTV